MPALPFRTPRFTKLIGSAVLLSASYSTLTTAEELTPSDSSSSESVDELDLQYEAIKARALATYRRAKEAVKQELQDLDPDGTQTELAKDELAKLYALEYKVVDFEKNQSSKQIEEILATLGKDRWDCFFGAHSEDKLRIFCKRRPDSYLRYLPKLLGTLY